MCACACGGVCVCARARSGQPGLSALWVWWESRMEAGGPHLLADVEQHHDDLLSQPSVGWPEAQQQVDHHLEACVVAPNKVSSFALL